MSFSIQTNVNSLIAQENLRVNSLFQSQTIQRLTSGYRINQSGDDAAGLSVANQFRSSIAELTQGVANANDGVAQLQIMDGGINNIAKMLDRLKTLASQSASGTFTGNRTILNNEFQSELAEIDRQAQSIGLNAGGLFATNLQVYMGAGSGSAGAANSGAVALANSLVSVDLSRSTVDSQSLGLQGMQFTNVNSSNVGIDIGPGAGVHSVANVVSTSSGNTTATTGYTVFNFSGTGFSGANKIAVRVNLSGVTDVTTLANNINAAIESAGNVSSQYATAFKNAGIVASVHTDSQGGKELSFTSSTAAFQVEAGDQMANALLGNFAVGGTNQSLWTSVGASIASTVHGAVQAGGAAAAFTADTNGAYVRISGAGLANPIDLQLTGTTVGGVVTNLQNAIAATTANGQALQAAGVTVSFDGTNNYVVFQSYTGEPLNVQVTGDTTGALGFGKFAQAAANTSADYTDITAGSAYAPTVAAGTSTLQVSVAGGAAQTVSVDLSQGATAASWTSDGTATGDAHGLTFSINGVSMTAAFAGAGVNTLAAAVTAINGVAGVTVHAYIDTSGHLVVTNNTPGTGTISVTGAGAAGAIAALFGGSSPVLGQSSSLTGVLEQINNTFTTNATLAAADLKAVASGGSIRIQSGNGTYFRVGATSASTTDLGFGAVGAGGGLQAYTVPTSTNAQNTSNDAGGVSYLANIASTNTALSLTNTTGLTFTGLQFGNDSQAITLSANSATGQLQSMTITLQNKGTTRTGADIDSAIAYINQQLQQSNNATLSQIVAVKENNGHTATINFLSPLASFTVGVASNANNGTTLADGVNAGVAGTFTSSTNGSASNIAIDTQAGAEAAITAIGASISTLGSVQATVGKGQNQLGYAIGLAHSQIANFSAAEAQIRDADIASEAANLTKASVLQQASLAAMAQANSAPQAVLALLRG